MTPSLGKTKRLINPASARLTRKLEDWKAGVMFSQRHSLTEGKLLHAPPSTPNSHNQIAASVALLHFVLKNKEPRTKTLPSLSLTPAFPTHYVLECPAATSLQPSGSSTTSDSKWTRVSLQYREKKFIVNGGKRDRSSQNIDSSSFEYHYVSTVQ